MTFLQAFPIAIIDEDYDAKQAAGIGMRQLAEAIEKEGFRVVAGVLQRLLYVDGHKMPLVLGRLEAVRKLIEQLHDVVDSPIRSFHVIPEKQELCPNVEE